MLAIGWKQGQPERHYAKGQKSLKDEINCSDTKRQQTHRVKPHLSDLNGNNRDVE